MARLEKDLERKMFLGVCSGIENYTNIDATVWRLMFVVGTFLYLPMFVVYFIMALVMPAKN